jgi:hypothetical protein
MVDALMPSELISVEATWHIITEVPQKSLAGRQIDVQVRDINCDESDMRQYNTPQLTSGGHTIELYQAILSEVTYDAATGKKSENQYHPDFEASNGEFPKLIVGDVINTSDYWRQNDAITIWDQDFNVLAQPKTLSAAMLYELGPGTYYAGYNATIMTDFNPIVDEYNCLTAMLLVTRIVPDTTSGMAGQLASLGTFDWTDVTDVSLDTQVDGHMETTYADQDGIVRLMARLCTTPAVTVRTLDGMPGTAQVITLQGTTGMLARICWSGEFMTLDTGGKRYTVDEPHWLFGELWRSALGNLLISQPEAAALAARDLAGRPKMTGGTFSLVPALITYEEYYGWDLVYDTAIGQLCVFIVGDFLMSIFELDK